MLEYIDSVWISFVTKIKLVKCQKNVDFLSRYMVIHLSYSRELQIKVLHNNMPTFLHKIYISIATFRMSSLNK